MELIKHHRQMLIINKTYFEQDVSLRASHRHSQSLAISYSSWNLHTYALGASGRAPPPTLPARCTNDLPLPMTSTTCGLHVEEPGIDNLLHKMSRKNNTKSCLVKPCLYKVCGLKYGFKDLRKGRNFCFWYEI